MKQDLQDIINGTLKEPLKTAHRTFKVWAYGSMVLIILTSLLLLVGLVKLILL